MGRSDRSGILAQLRKGVLEYCVLALLSEREHYGFELVRRLSEDGSFLTSGGTIYPLLSRLRKDRMVATSWKESATGPPRRYYKLTAIGADALEQFASDWERFRESTDQFLRLRSTA